MDKILQVWPQRHRHGNCNIWSVPYADHETRLWAMYQRWRRMMDELHFTKMWECHFWFKSFTLKYDVIDDEPLLLTCNMKTISCMECDRRHRKCLITVNTRAKYNRVACKISISQSVISSSSLALVMMKNNPTSGAFVWLFRSFQSYDVILITGIWGSAFKV